LFTTPVRGKIQLPNLEEHTMIWETPAYVDIRLGFEVTMYVYNR
jgi:coenzyme PQQ precursor peptide PqqA